MKINKRTSLALLGGVVILIAIGVYLYYYSNSIGLKQNWPIRQQPLTTGYQTITDIKQMIVRQNVHTGDQVKITGYVGRIVDCPPCPPGVSCNLCGAFWVGLVGTYTSVEIYDSSTDMIRVSFNDLLPDVAGLAYARQLERVNQFLESLHLGQVMTMEGTIMAIPTPETRPPGSLYNFILIIKPTRLITPTSKLLP